jgi:hypothetical protein
VLANWLASTNNPYFAKNLANIVWAHFLGKGIIEPVDDVRISTNVRLFGTVKEERAIGTRVSSTRSRPASISGANAKTGPAVK